MPIDYEMLDDEFGGLPKREKVQESTKPIGSLTDNARFTKPRRDGAHKRRDKWDSISEN